MKSSNKSKNGVKKEKNKKSKSRHLSPSFRKGLGKEKDKKEKEKEKEDNKFINNLKEDKNENKELLKPHKKNNSKQNKSKEKKHHHHHISQDKIFDIISINAMHEGRIKKFASYSKEGIAEDGFIKINQDSFFVLQYLYGIKDFNIFSVMDGHGLDGHLVSHFVTKYLTTFFKDNKKLKSYNNLDEIYYILKKNDFDLIKRAFIHAEIDLSKNRDIDSNLSGTTCVMVIQIGEKILCASVGNSRAILVKEYYEVNKIIPLSREQKPDDPGESERIIEFGGEISQFVEDGENFGPYRVWKKGAPYPGISMSRTIGDIIATTLGVISEPKIIEETIDNFTKFIVIATDGLWEYLKNQEVAEIVKPFYINNDPNGACKALIRESTKLWIQEDTVVDDITVIVVFF